MEIRAIDSLPVRTDRDAPERPPLDQLRGLVLDLLLLQRQLVLALTDEDRAAAEAAPLALMAAACVSERLAQGYAFLQRRGIETAATAAFRRYFDHAEAAVRRLRAGVAADEIGAPEAELAYDAELVRGLGLARILRLREMDAPAARTGKAVLFAASLFLAAAHQILAAVAPRHEPETGEAFDRPASAPQLARIA
jgi:hypothetical protein